VAFFEVLLLLSSRPGVCEVATTFSFLAEESTEGCCKSLIYREEDVKVEPLLEVARNADAFIAK
jgi:hypothetical protein